MAGPQTAVAESSQALFCAIADFLGEKKSNQVLDLSKYPTYVEFKTKLPQSVMNFALKRIRTPGVTLKDIDSYLTNEVGWYK